MTRAAGIIEQLFLALDGFHPMNVVVCAHLDAPLDPERLAAAAAKAQSTHPMLRARLDRTGAVPAWRLDAGPLPIAVRHRSGPDDWRCEAERELALAFADEGPFCRLTILNGPAGSDLLLTFHHALADASAGMRLLPALLGHVACENMPELPQPFEQRAAARLGMSAPHGAVRGSMLPLAPWRARLVHRRLDAGATAALVARARAGGATMHGALAASLLLATGRPGVIALTSPVSVRDALGLGDAFTLAVCEVTTTHSMDHEAEFWPQATAITTAIAARAAPEAVLPAHLAGLDRLSAGARLGEFAAGIGSFAPDRLGLTNLGRVDGPGLRSLDFAVVPPATQLVVAAVTGSDGRLGLTLTYPDPAVTEADAQALMDRLVARLSAVAVETAALPTPVGLDPITATPIGLDPITATPVGLDLAALSPAKRRLLALRLRQQGRPVPEGLEVEGQEAPSSATASEPAGPAPPSYNQRAMWFLSRIAPQSAAYTLPYAADIDGPLDPATLAAALGLLRRRHDVLDARYPVVDGTPVQQPAPDLAFDLRHVDARNWSEAALDDAIADAYAQPFDLEAGLAWRAVLFTRGPEPSVLFLAFHHIVIDFWSLALVVEDLRACLATVGTGTQLPPPPARTYADFARWQQAALAGPQAARARQHWRERLGGPLPVLDLPTDRPRPPVQGFRGGSRRFALEPALAAAARKAAQDHGVTLFALLVATCQILLHRWSGATDVLVGTPTSGRADETFAATVGDFINPVVIRADFSDDPGFAEHLRRTAADAATALEHRAYPFSQVVQDLGVQADPGRSPVFQAMVVLQNQLVHAARGPGSSAGPEFRSRDIALQGSQLDLTFEFRPDGEGLAAEIKYDSDLFDPATIDRLGSHFQTLLAGALVKPDMPVSALPLMTPDERQRVIGQWNDTTPAWSIGHPLALVRAQVAARPNAVAVSQGDEHLTYAGLWARAGALAGWLAGLGVAPGDRVGICLARTPDLVTALLAVWRCGAAYVPLDHDHPAERLAYIVGDAGCAVVLIDATTRPALAGLDIRLVELPVETSVGEAPAHREDPAAAAYLIFTSGTTGRPKGVTVSHRNLGNFLGAMLDLLGPGPDDRLLAVTTLAFDIAGLELVLPLAAGARVEIARAEETRDGVLLARRLAAFDPTIMQATPAGWRLLLAAGWRPDPRLVMLAGGEALPRDLADTLLPEGAGCTLWNLFGPTETTIWSTAHRVGRGEGAIPIGRPIANTRVYVVDPAGQPVPVGVVGELLIGGEGVALGYHGRPDLTSERFRPDPFVPGGRVYRTGDLARWRADGVLMFHGRADHQVKLRGFRIELEEIEAVLERHAGVREAVVALRPAADGESRLAAWIVTGEPAPSVAELMAHLAAALPAYMVPSTLGVLARLPRTPNGKVDRKALPDPTPAAALIPVAPLTGVQDRLATLWREVLGRASVGAHDSFFELGGHSLLLARLQARINADLADLLPEGGIAMTDLFRFPTIASLAAHLGDAPEAGVLEDLGARADLRRVARPGQAARRRIAGSAGDRP